MELIKKNIPVHGKLMALGTLNATETPGIWVTHTDGHHYVVRIDVDEEDGPLIAAELLERKDGGQVIELVFADIIRLQFLPGPDGWGYQTARPPGNAPARL